jgi:hypothetical protein
MIDASVAAAGVMLNRVCGTAYGKRLNYDSGRLTKGDIAILRLLAAVELIECDLWQQYEELGGATQGPQNGYQLALQFLDGDGAQYVTSNTLDEISHATYLNAYLESEGADPVNFDRFRNLRGSSASGAQNIGRLTNLMHLDMDTGWYIRYRTMEDPNYGASIPRTIRIVNRQSIPRTDAECDDPQQVQAIANTAALHFGYIEHAGSSLYASFRHKLKRAAVLKVVLGIGGDEIAHFLVWVDFAGSAIHGAPFNVLDAQSSVANQDMALPYLNRRPSVPLCQTCLSFPVPGDVISKAVACRPVIHPLDDQFSGAIPTVNSFARNGLFVGQSPEFMHTLTQMAEDADNAIRD